LLVVFAAATAATAMLTPIVRAIARRLGSRERRVGDRAHFASTPRVGGVAIAITWAVTLLVSAHFGNDAIRVPLNTLPLAPILIGSLLVFAVGLVDDVRPLSAGVKVTFEALAACALIGAGVVILSLTVFGVTFQLGWLSVVVTMTWMIGITNAFNLIDGLDGLATGLAIIAGVTCAAIVILRGDTATAVLLVALVGALAGFLPFNFNPASIFLGDSGSLFVGFVLALTAITGFLKGATALAVGVPILIFALPLLDVVITAVRRLRGTPAPQDRGLRAAVARLLRPDQEHIHHRLVSRGFSHLSAVLCLYAVAISLAVIALLTASR
jgi:UDP-GlcNAc:undecaprenyl-phosphate GlcNAc-1-phosphate transferase